MTPLKATLLALIGFGILAGCAGTEGRPEVVKNILERKYVGKKIDVVILDLGPAKIMSLSGGNLLYVWRKQTEKYKSNKLIKSDERCVITMLVDTGGTVRKIGRVDDSLGAWEISYCREQFSL